MRNRTVLANEAYVRTKQMVLLLAAVAQVIAAIAQLIGSIRMSP